ncbi:MAG: nucleotidyltransferase substrate binding protein [Phycisphaerae bacterium]
MKLDLSSLRKAVESLDRTINITKDDTFFKNLSEEAKEAIKSGVIQNFEVAYETCWKFARRWLKENVPVEQAERPRSRKELFRLAAQYGLIKDPVVWFSYGDARNLTSHTYDENTAESVFETAMDFIKDAKDLLKKLEESNE